MTASPVPETDRSQSVVCPSIKYVYDLHTYVWREVDTLIRIVNPSKKLGKGGMRVCYEVEQIDEDGSALAMVAKMFRPDINDLVEVDYYNEGEAQCMCEAFAENFNRVHVDPSVRKPNISFLQCYVVRISVANIPQEFRGKRSGFFSYRLPTTGEIMFVMEPKLNGQFTKYNSNFGETYHDDKNYNYTPSQLAKREEICQAAEAFSHFTLSDSGGSMLVCDLQGVNDFLTDPQIHTENGKGFGMGNMGMQGIQKWIDQHKCNDICKALGLGTLCSASIGRMESKTKFDYQRLQQMCRREEPVKPNDLIPFSKPLNEMTEEERLMYAIELSKLTS